MKGMMRWQSGGAFTMPLAHEARADQADADELRHEGAASLGAAHECGWTGVDQSNCDSVGYRHTCYEYIYFYRIDICPLG
jgi:hypothetical protein